MESLWLRSQVVGGSWLCVYRVGKPLVLPTSILQRVKGMKRLTCRQAAEVMTVQGLELTHPDLQCRVLPKLLNDQWGNMVRYVVLVGAFKEAI